MPHPQEHGLFRGQNFMTPEYVDSGWITPGLIAWEITKGRGMRDEPIFGVTFQRTDERHANGYPKCQPQSGLEYTLAAARARGDFEAD